MKHISVTHLSVSYKNYSVLTDVHFEASQGEFIAIVGKSGSGKTTFLQAIAGLIHFSGELHIPKNIGMMFQNYAAFPWLTVAENISFGLGNKNKDEQRRILTEHLKLAELTDKKDKYPGELSGGQTQRVALARSLAHDPDILLMDEPYGALDAYTRDKMQQWLLDVWAMHKKTIIFVTHNIEEALFLADRVLVLNGGKFIKEYIVPFPRKRGASIKFSPEFNQLRQEIFESLNK